MSGTSGDGIDISLIKSDGSEKCEFIVNKYFSFTDELYEKFHNLKDLVKNLETKIEIIVTFLALLEMIKQSEIICSQKENFEDIEIKLIIAEA